jgi:hypothetical protein
VLSRQPHSCTRRDAGGVVRENVERYFFAMQRTDAREQQYRENRYHDSRRGHYSTAQIRPASLAGHSS